MKNRMTKRYSEAVLATTLAQWCETLDRGMPSLRTWCLLAGVVAVAAHAGRPADFLFVTGLVCQAAMWFESWWETRASR